MARQVAERSDTIPALANVFRTYGFDGASLAVITEHTGLGKGSLYNFFPRGKEEMAEVVLDEVDGDLYDVDAGWDEYDHLALAGETVTPTTDPREFQAHLDAALGAWVSGAPSPVESFAEFSARVLRALDEAVAQAGSGRRVAVFTSGGPIALVASHLLAGDASLFIPLNRVVVNASVTTLIVGRGGTRLLTYNEHGHVPADQVTFR